MDKRDSGTNNDFEQKVDTNISDTKGNIRMFKNSMAIQILNQQIIFVILLSDLLFVFVRTEDSHKPMYLQ